MKIVQSVGRGEVRLTGERAWRSWGVGEVEVGRLVWRQGTQGGVGFTTRGVAVWGLSGRCEGFAGRGVAV